MISWSFKYLVGDNLILDLLSGLLRGPLIWLAVYFRFDAEMKKLKETSMEAWE